MLLEIISWIPLFGEYLWRAAARGGIELLELLETLRYSLPRKCSDIRERQLGYRTKIAS